MDDFYVYMIRCLNGCLYTGYTSDLERRLEEHRSGRGARYIRSFGFKELVYVEARPTRSDAMRRECEIKRLSKSAKEGLASRTPA